MVQISQPWGGTLTGDADRAPYSADEWDDMFQDINTSDGNWGVLSWRYAHLAGTIPGANTFRVATGAALVLGKWYRNDANVDFNPLNAAVWREDRIVLSATWGAIVADPTREPANQEAQTIRLVRLINPAESVGAPASTKTDGTLYEINLFRIRTDNVGTVTIQADDREFISNFSRILRRQGGSATLWNTIGTTNYQVPSSYVHVGAITWTGGAAANGNVTLTFPIVFTNLPLVFIQVINRAADVDVTTVVSAIAANQCVINWIDNSGGNHTDIDFAWWAVGPA